jgi:hypothetical protein
MPGRTISRSKVPLRKIIIFLIALFALAHARAQSTQQGFSGQQLTLQIFSPLNQLVGGPYVTTVGASGGEFTNLPAGALPGFTLVPVNIGVSNTTISFDFSGTGAYSGYASSSFNGYVFTAQAGGPAIYAAEIDPTSTLGLDSSRVSVTPTQIFINVQGLSFTTATRAKLNILFEGAFQFVPIAPCRIADTRNPNGVFGGPKLSGGTTREFDVPQSACSIPSSATAYSLNVTAVPDGFLGYLTAWPTGQPRPTTSTLNSDGRYKANAAIIPAGTNGGINLFVSDPSQVILDITGYFAPAGTSSALSFYPLTPCRLVDTRGPAGALGGPMLIAGSTREFPVRSACNLPSDAAAYSLNVTAVPRGSLPYLTIWPSGQAQPTASTLNAPTGTVAANGAIVPAGSNGDVSVYVGGASDVVIDVNGYFATPGAGGLSLYTTAPCRVIDTRTGTEAFTGVFSVNIESSGCAPPSTARAYVVNATVVPSNTLDYLTLWPAGQTQPQVSTLNAYDGVIASNMAIVPTVNGGINAFATNPTQLILDLFGYYAP